MAMGMARVNRSSHRSPRRVPGDFAPGRHPVVNLFSAGSPGAGSPDGCEPRSGKPAPRSPPPKRAFTRRVRPTNRVWAIERVAPPPEPTAPDQLARIAHLWADATMLVLAALGAALLVAALVL